MCRGLLTEIQRGAGFSSAPIPYIADHDTAPPESQIVKTDPSSLLIRSLQIRKAREEGSKKAKRPFATDKGKRPANEIPAQDQNTAKQVKQNSKNVGEAGPSSSVPAPSRGYFTKLGLQAKTIKDLQAILRNWSLTTSGRKEDLIQRILDKQAKAAANSS